MTKEIISEIFQEKFENIPEIIIKSPGRINLLGEHTDYNDGFVLPATIDKTMNFAASQNKDKMLRIHAIDLNEYIELPIHQLTKHNYQWANYLIGVFSLMPEKSKLLGIDCVFSGNIPIGGGLSSSAAMTTGFATLISRLFNLNISKTDIAKLSQKAEHEFAGVKCGIMDQFAAVFGKEKHAIKLDCRTLDYEYFPVQFPDYQFILVDTKVKHSLASSEYNKRRIECEEGVAILQKKDKNILNLRDVSPEMIYRYKSMLNETIYKRCKYVVEENARVIEAGDLLKKREILEFGELMYKTHYGLSQEYEVSCIELDSLVDFARASGYVAGARMIGGGFGGCTLNLVKNDKADEFISSVKKHYKEKFKKEPGIYEVIISNGISIY